MKSIYLILTLIALGFAGLPTIIGCVGGNVAVASCDKRYSDGYCENFTVSALSLQTECEMAGDIWEESACPTVNLIGACTDSDGDTKLHYSDSVRYNTVISAREYCESESGSTWTETF